MVHFAPERPRLLLNKNETPFAPFFWYYEQIKAAGR